MNQVLSPNPTVEDGVRSVEDNVILMQNSSPEVKNDQQPLFRAESQKMETITPYVLQAKENHFWEAKEAKTTNPKLIATSSPRFRREVPRKGQIGA